MSSLQYSKKKLAGPLSRNPQALKLDAWGTEKSLCPSRRAARQSLEVEGVSIEDFERFFQANVGLSSHGSGEA